MLTAAGRTELVGHGRHGAKHMVAKTFAYLRVYPGKQRQSAPKMFEL